MLVIIQGINQGLCINQVQKVSKRWSKKTQNPPACNFKKAYRVFLGYIRFRNSTSEHLDYGTDILVDKVFELFSLRVETSTVQQLHLLEDGTLARLSRTQND